MKMLTQYEQLSRGVTAVPTTIRVSVHQPDLTRDGLLSTRFPRTFL